MEVVGEIHDELNICCSMFCCLCCIEDGALYERVRIIFGF